MQLLALVESAPLVVKVMIGMVGCLVVAMLVRGAIALGGWLSRSDYGVWFCLVLVSALVLGFWLTGVGS